MCISDVPWSKCSVSVYSTHFWCTNWNVFCFCAQYTFFIYRGEIVLFLCTVQFMMYRQESVSFLCTLHISDVAWWKCPCFCAHYIYVFLMYLCQSVLFLCTVHISDVPTGMCSVCVHGTYFWWTVLKVFCFCKQYTFMMYRQESVSFLCKVHIYDIAWWKCSVSVNITYVYFWFTLVKVFCFCVQYTFLMYYLECVLFACTVQISDVTSRKCSVLCTGHIK